LCFIPFTVFYVIFLPLTLYSSYFLLSYWNPKIIEHSLLINGKYFLFIEACVASVGYWLLWVLTWLIKDASLKTRLKLIVTSFSLFFAMNIFRIVVLILIDLYYGRATFDLVHIAMWKFVSGIYVAGVWIFCVKIYKITSIPLYDDLKKIYRDSLFTRRGSGKSKGLQL